MTTEDTSTTRRPPRPSIQDVADRAGVSIKTVSRVINGSDGVRPATLKRVRQAIDALGYAPSSAARQLARSRGTRTVRIGVVIPVEPEKAMSHRVFFETFQGLGDAMHGDGHQLILHINARTDSFVETWRSAGTDGLIVMSAPAADPRVVELQRESVPFVLTCRPDQPGSQLDESVAWVDSDHTHGGQVAMDHLLSLGHTRIGLVNGPRELMVSRLREVGVQTSLEQHGLATDLVRTVDAEFSVEDGQAIGGLMLNSETRPTAIFCGSDSLALGVVNAAEAAGLRVPQDVSVVGYDDIELSRFLNPPLTTVRQDSRLKGRLAATTLLRRLDGGATRDGRPEQHLLTTELVVRRSSGPPPR
jgi:LacI family transcriptional regulator